MLGGPLERSGFLPPSSASNRRAVVYSCSAVLSFTGTATIGRVITGFNETLGFFRRPWNPWPGVDDIRHALKNAAGMYWNPVSASFLPTPITLGPVEIAMVPQLEPAGLDHPGLGAATGRNWRTFTGSTATSRESAATVPQQFLMGGPRVYRARVRPENLPTDGQPLFLELRFSYVEQQDSAIIDVGQPPTRLRRAVMLHLVPFVYDEGRPIVAIWFPAAGAITTTPVTISGSVSDPAEGFASGLRRASLQIRDLEENLRFDARSGDWSALGRAMELDLEPVRGASAAATFSVAWDEPSTGGQRYRAELRAQDEAGNWSLRSTRDFFVDRERPVIEFEWPEPINDLDDGVPIAGTVTDDLEVAEIDLQIYDTTTGYNWDPATGELVDRVVSIGLPVGTPSGDRVDFSYTWQPSRGGAFAALVRVRDTAGRTAASQRTFQVIAPEVVQPLVVDITTPATEGETLPVSVVSVSGTASSSAGSIQLQLKLFDPGGALGTHSWNGSGCEDPPFAYTLSPTLPPAGSSGSVNWSYDFDTVAAGALGGSGTYLVRVEATDSAAAYALAGRGFLVV